MIDFVPDPLIAAHRGASALAPENTLAAFSAARRTGADLYELDVQETRDLQLVVIHDSTLDRTTNVEELYPDRAPWRVRDFTLAEIQRLDAGGWFAARFAGQRVPTLAAVLHTMRGGPRPMLEVKHPERAPDIGDRLAEVLAGEPAVKPIVQSFDWTFVRSLHLGAERAVLGTPRADELPDVAKYTDYVCVKNATLTPSYVRTAHRYGLKVLGFTVNNVGPMRRALRSGADGLLTNRPRALRRYVSENWISSVLPPSGKHLRSWRETR